MHDLSILRYMSQRKSWIAVYLGKLSHADQSIARDGGGGHMATQVMSSCKTDKGRHMDGRKMMLLEAAGKSRVAIDGETG
jgi:hypothetical protein